METSESGIFSKAEWISENKIQETAPNIIVLKQCYAPSAGFQLQTSWVLSALPSGVKAAALTSDLTYTKTSLEYNVTKHWVVFLLWGVELQDIVYISEKKNSTDLEYEPWNVECENIL